MKNITIIGAGYVGVPTAAHWASVHKITVFDIDENKINALKQVKNGEGDLYIHEPTLLETFKKNSSNIFATTDINEALANADVVFLAVGTPQRDDGRADLSYIFSAADLIGQSMQKNLLVINKSTCPPGTAFCVKDRIEKQILQREANFSVVVGSCPEFLAEGTAMRDLANPSRVVIGCDDMSGLKVLKEMFDVIYPGKSIFMDTVSAELTKYAANAMLASRISFMNSLSILCDKIGANIESIRRGIGSDPRIGEKFLHAGFGYGGSCFGKDTKAISSYANLLNSSLHMVDETIKINDLILDNFYSKIERHFDDLNGVTILVWGVGFKADTDDIRDSRSIEICKRLMGAGAKLLIYDPVSAARDNFSRYVQGNFEVVVDPYSRLDECSGLVIGNENKIFRDLDVEKFSRGKAIFDAKNVLSYSKITTLKNNGVVYFSVGKDVLSRVNDLDLVNFLQNNYFPKQL